MVKQYCALLASACLRTIKINYEFQFMPFLQKVIELHKMCKITAFKFKD